MNEAYGSDSTVMRAQARVGRTLREKWRLDRLLGVGGFAAVYAGSHRNGAKGAIKMLHLELSLDAEIKARFLREGYLANTVDHPGVVRVLDDDVDLDGAAFIVMEMLTGETLDARWERHGRRHALVEVLCATDPLLDVLAAAHEKGIVHRDVKPENVFLTHDGTTKLLDFGIARLRDGATSATRSGSAFGTPAFMSPEQALGRNSEVGPLSDVWAVGATMFVLLSGSFVHQGETGNEQLVSAATRRAPSLASVAPDVPPLVVQLVDRALAFEPAGRWPSARAMQDALREAYHSMNGSPVQTAPRLQVPDVRASIAESQAKPLTETTGAATNAERVATPSVHRTHTAPVAIGATIGLLGLAAAGYMALARGSPSPPQTDPSPAVVAVPLPVTVASEVPSTVAPPPPVAPSAVGSPSAPPAASASERPTSTPKDTRAKPGPAAADPFATKRNKP